MGAGGGCGGVEGPCRRGSGSTRSGGGRRESVEDARGGTGDLSDDKGANDEVGSCADAKTGRGEDCTPGELVGGDAAGCKATK